MAEADDPKDVPAEVWLAYERQAKDAMNLWAPDVPALQNAVHAAMIRAWRSGRAVAAEPVAVKPLEWVGPGGRYAYKSGFFVEWTAASALGTLCIRYAEHNPEAKPGYRTPPYPPYYAVADMGGKFTTLDDAKAAVFAGYEARIRSALVLPA